MEKDADTRKAEEVKQLSNSNSAKDFIQVDGSYLEGGGQILRISTTLAVLFEKEMRIFQIRGNRSNPGLQRQHLASVGSLAEITGSTIKGSKMSSKEINLYGGKVKNIDTNKFHKIDATGAGSIGLMIQQTLPCFIFASGQTNVKMMGGTLVNFAPSTFYVSTVLKPMLSRMNVEFDIELKRHGLFPIGGGEVDLKVKPTHFIEPICILERGELKQVEFCAIYTENMLTEPNKNLIKDCIRETRKNLNSYLKQEKGISKDDFELEDYIIFKTSSVKLPIKKSSSTLFFQLNLIFSNCVVTVEELFSEKKDKKFIREKFQENFNNSVFSHVMNRNICLDEYTVDHLIIFMALAKGTSKIKLGTISKHTETALYVIKLFVPSLNFKIIKEESYNILEIEGISWLR